MGLRGTSYLLGFANSSMAVTLAPGTSSFPDTRSWRFNGNNELIEQPVNRWARCGSELWALLLDLYVRKCEIAPIF